MLKIKHIFKQQKILNKRTGASTFEIWCFNYVFPLCAWLVCNLLYRNLISSCNSIVFLIVIEE